MLLVLSSIAHLLQLSRVSWTIWAVALLILVAGISMLVYFITRFKRIEKEAEEDWSLSQRSLFVSTPPAAEEEKQEQAAHREALEEAGPAVEYEAAEPQSGPEPE
ncbi:MAG TPA: hypothetical protein VNO14_17145, partial [Blastocatellia bacterium]|nr:hypothetical protein [Blastocatellia bacterium]